MPAPFSPHDYPSKVDVVLANLIEAEKRRASISYWLSEGATGERFTNGDPAAEITRTTQEITKLRYELDQALCSAALAETYRPSPTSAAVIETMCRRLRNNGSVRQIEVRSAMLPAVVSPASAM
jgi:hypothetical protein